MVLGQIFPQKKDARIGHPFFTYSLEKTADLEFMAFHTLIALLQVFLVQFAAAPGFGAMAVIAQIALRLDQSGGFTGMAAHA